MPQIRRNSGFLCFRFTTACIIPIPTETKPLLLIRFDRVHFYPFTVSLAQKLTYLGQLKLCRMANRAEMHNIQTQTWPSQKAHLCSCTSWKIIMYKKKSVMEATSLEIAPFLMQYDDVQLIHLQGFKDHMNNIQFRVHLIWGGWSHKDPIFALTLLGLGLLITI